MADNIKIIGNITDIITVSRYDEKDINLISSRNLQEYFGGKNDYIEYYIYNIEENLLNVDYNYLNYKLPPNNGLKPGTSVAPNTFDSIPTENVGVQSTLSSQTSSLYPIIEIDPVKELQNVGYTSGEFAVRYNFFQNRISNSDDRALFIKEISPDRTEIRVGSTTIPDSEIEKVANELIDEVNNLPYYVDYLLNFGNNLQCIAVNIAFNPTPSGNEILFKLYKPLPEDIVEKDVLWVVSEKVNPYTFNIDLSTSISQPPLPTLRGANFDIPTDQTGTVATSYTNYQASINKLLSLQSSSYNQLLNLMNTQSIHISVNYNVDESSDFSNFVFFGSAKSRVDNFYNKVKKIEDYNNKIAEYLPKSATTKSLQTEINLFSSSINTIVSQFDGYESYLYFESSSYSGSKGTGSYTWPKSGSLKPFKLLSTGSSNSVAWYATQSLLAQNYDNKNKDSLLRAIPSFILEDENNQPYVTFLNMVGHYFDNIWIYLKSITDINLANNNLKEGISKDLVYERLKSLGLKLYSSQAGEDVNQFLIGANTGSSVWDNNFW